MRTLFEPGHQMHLRHGHARVGRHTPTYRTWRAMHSRCRPQGHYGLKGITVCPRWLVFENFLTDMGERPDGTSIDRIDTTGHYTPDNCRWATKSVQATNRRPCGSGCLCGLHSKSAETRAKLSAAAEAQHARRRKALAGTA